MNKMISKKIRQNIFDTLVNKKMFWYGSLGDGKFLNRLYDLKSLPSHDGRFKDAEGDIWQHTVNNDDWEMDWIFTDARFKLLDGENKVFLDFLCETLHPVVRDNKNEIEEMLSIYNTFLKEANYQIFSKSLGALNIYGWNKDNYSNVALKSVDILSHEYITEQYSKAYDRIQNSDYEGAITIARSLIETVLLSILDEEDNKYNGDLDKIYKAFKGRYKNFDSSAEKFEQPLKQILTGLSSIIGGIASIRNKTGDGHGKNIKSYKSYKPSKHHAELIINTCSTFSNFIVSSLEYQKINSL